MIANQPIYLSISLILLLCMGCGGGSISTPASPPKMANNVAESVISNDECIAFAQELEELIKAGDGKGAAELIDQNVLFNDAMEESPVDSISNNLRNQLREGVSMGVISQFERIAEEIENGGVFRFLRIRSGAGPKRLLFRVRSNTGTLGYVDVIPYRSGNQILGRDVYVHSMGEPMSQTFRHIIILEAGAAAGSLKSDNEYAKHLPDVNEMMLAIDNGKYADCLKAYHRLPPSLQREKHFLMMRLRAAQGISDEESAAAFDAFREAYPDDSAADLYLLGSLMLRKQYPAARETIDRIEKIIEGDPALDLKRSSIFLKEGKFAEADLAAQRAIASEPTLVDGLWARITVTLRTHEFARTVKLLTTIQKEHGIELSDLTGLPDYAEFVKSEEYQKWQAEKSSTP